MIKFFGLFILLGLFSNFCGGNGGNVRTGDSAAKFGEKIKFSKDAPVTFSDFILTYIGKRSVAVDMPAQAKPSYREFLYHDFKVKNGDEEKTVSWSSGTGDIGPVSFEIGGKNFALELAMSDKLGALDTNELVIWKK